jgi:mlo protein
LPSWLAGEGKGGAGQITLEYTPTWIAAAVCSVIVVISLLLERMLHRLGKVRRPVLRRA